MRTLLVEDDVSLGTALRQVLSRDGMDAVWLRTVPDARRYLASEAVELLLLDVVLPGESGLDLLRWVRARDAHLPIILMTVRASIDERAYGLDSGADDYLAKPFAMEELQARIRALVRRSRDRDMPAQRIGLIEFHPSRRLVRIGERAVQLSPREAQVLTALAADPGAVLTRRQLATSLIGDVDPGSNAVDVHVHNLRMKIGHQRILTVRGVGYCLRPDV